MDAPLTPPAGAATFDSWLDYGYQLWERKPLVTIVLGALVCSWVFTHYVKLNLPLALDERRRDWAIRRMAFFFAFIPMVVVWPNLLDKKLFLHDGWYTYNATVFCLLLSALIGAASPTLYTFAMFFLNRFEWFRNALSYSTRKVPSPPAVPTSSPSQSPTEGSKP